MEFHVLGPLAVLDGAGVEVPVKGARLRALLALLVLHAGEVVAADRIVEELWGDQPPVDPGAALQNQVSRLRSALRAAGTDPIETRAPGYVLAVEPGAVDALRFEAAAREGRELLDSGKPLQAAEVLAGGLALWRGNVLADVADDRLGTAERARWDEMRRVAVEDRVEADLAAGRHAELVAELEALVAAEPLRERRTAQLMLALYRAGRQADALRAYQHTREYLADELGIEPGAELRRLEAAILDQDAALDAPAPERLPPAAAALPRCSIALPLTVCIGRDSEVADIEELLRTHRLVTLVGPGGAGKTRLAIEVGRRLEERLRDGAALVELAALDGNGPVVPAVTRALGFDELRGEQGPAEELATVLGDRNLLVVLDNCEHVVDDAAALVATLLGRCPNVSVLATSRQALGLPGEMLFLVPPLASEAAVALFAERASAVTPAFVVDEQNRGAVAEVCERLDGMPLAIELAASRMRVFSVTQLAARLDDRFRVLNSATRGVLARQQTLRAVVDWSYELLDDDERRVFAQLSVFAGRFPIDAAEAVARGGVDTDASEVVARLVDKSLVLATPHGTAMRFSMLQTLAEYGRERLEAAGEAHAARRRLVGWILDQARGGAPKDQAPWDSLHALELDVDNVRVALAWAQEHEPALALETAAWLGAFWVFHDMQAEGYRILAAGLQHDPPLPDIVRARALAWAGALAITAGDIERGDAWGDEAIAVAERSSNLQFVGRTSTLRGERLAERGYVDRAAQHFQRARRCLRAVDDTFGLAYLDLREGIVASIAGDAARAYWLSHRALRAFRRIGDQGMLVLALQRVGECADVCGYVDEGAAALAEALARNADLPGIGRRASLVSRLARVRVNEGRLDEALVLAEQGVALARSQSWGLHTGMALQARARVFDALGRLDDAIADLDAAVVCLRASAMDAMAKSVERQLVEMRAQVARA